MSGPGEGDRSVGLPVGTRVWNRKTDDRARFGMVMPYSPQYSRGSFPVRFDDQIWEMLDASDVSAVSPEDEAAIRSQPPDRAPRKTIRKAS